MLGFVGDPDVINGEMCFSRRIDQCGHRRRAHSYVKASENGQVRVDPLVEGMAMVASSSPELFVVPPLRRALRSEQAPDPLRDRLAAVVEQSALEMLDPALIEAQAEDMRLIERHRVHHAGLLTVALILSALQRSTDTEGRWLDAQRTYESIGGARSGKTSFRNNVRKLVPLMDRMLRRRLKKLAERTPDSELRGQQMDRSRARRGRGGAKVATALSGLYPGTRDRRATRETPRGLRALQRLKSSSLPILLDPTRSPTSTVRADRRPGSASSGSK